MKLRRNMTDPESRRYWRLAVRRMRQRLRENWPAWKRAGVEWPPPEPRQ